LTETNPAIGQIEPAPAMISIDQLQAGVFWCARGGLGISDEEVEAYKAGTVPEPRRTEIECRITMAMNALRNAEVPGAQFWMTLRRMVS
jgi:hypothetical protein